jgi:hypothetical protein
MSSNNSPQGAAVMLAARAIKSLVAKLVAASTTYAFTILLAGTATRKAMCWWLALKHMATRTDGFAACGVWMAPAGASGS